MKDEVKRHNRTQKYRYKQQLEVGQLPMWQHGYPDPGHGEITYKITVFNTMNSLVAKVCNRYNNLYSL